MAYGSNYGYGLSDNSPNTPWNEPEVPEREFEIQATYSLTCIRTVWTDNYIPEYDEESGRFSADTSETDWRNEFEADEFTPLELIDELKKYAEQDLSMTGENTSKGRYLKRLIEACEGWSITDSEHNEL